MGNVRLMGDHCGGNVRQTTLNINSDCNLGNIGTQICISADKTRP